MVEHGTLFSEANGQRSINDAKEGIKSKGKWLR
jgi:hypothetical protein